MDKLTRRELLKAIGGVLLFSVSPVVSVAKTKPAQFVAVRVWPASSYTRVTIESEALLDYKYFHLQNPDRLVVDIQNSRLDELVRSIPAKVLQRDPYIAKARVGQYDDKTVRIVFDLKREVAPQIFTLKPVSNFKNRLVVDLYPASVASDDDPLMALLQEYNKGEVNSDGSTARPGQVNYGKDILGDKIGEILKSDQGNKIDQQDISSVGDINWSKIPRKPKGIKDTVIVLDPGHGGEDPGAIGKLGTREKDVVLIIARLVRTELKKLGYKVHMTRNEDVFIPLRVRVAKARQLKADVFVSIHADAFTKPSVRGTGVYALSQKGATSEAAKYLERTQNQSDEIGGVKKMGDKMVDSTLFDLTQTATINRSLKLGALVLKELGKINKLHKGYVDQAGFAVLKAPDIPSILVETAFISNLIEEKLLKTNSFRKQVSMAITQGIHGYIKSIS